MLKRLLVLAGLSTFAISSLFADFSYQETTTITGGMLLSMMKVVGVFSKQAKEPVKGELAIHGNKMVHRSQTHSVIIDLDAQTITSIDSQKKTYSVMTFDEMKRMLDEMSQKMQKSDKAEMTWKASVTNTGNSKTIAGYNAKEMVMKIEMEGKDKQSGQTGSMVITSHIWISSDVQGYSEVRDFYKKMAAKLDWTPSGNMFLSRPDVAKGMAEAYKEMAKIDGTPVYQTMSMGAEGTAPAGDSQATAAPQQPPPQQADHQSVGSALGGALGGRFGLGRHKQKDAPAAEPANGSSSANGQAGQSGSLVDMTMEYSGFSTASVDSSSFEIPAGFKKVEPDMKRGR